MCHCFLPAPKPPLRSCWQRRWALVASANCNDSPGAGGLAGAQLEGPSDDSLRAGGLAEEWLWGASNDSLGAGSIMGIQRGAQVLQTPARLLHKPRLQRRHHPLRGSGEALCSPGCVRAEPQTSTNPKTAWMQRAALRPRLSGEPVAAFTTPAQDHVHLLQQRQRPLLPNRRAGCVPSPPCTNHQQLEQLKPQASQ